MAAMAAPAALVRNVISAQGRPASTSARASGTAASALGMATTGMTPSEVITASKSRTFSGCSTTPPGPNVIPSPS